MKQTQTTTKSSEPDKVDEFMERLAHPLTDVVGALRQIYWRLTRKSAKRSSGTPRHSFILAR